MREEKPWERCHLCGRLVPPEMITLHHLKPVQKGGKAEHRVPMCKPCHKQLHAVFSNTELAQAFDSIEQLRRAPRLEKFLKWIGKQKPDRNFRTVSSLDRPGRRRR